MRIEELLAEAEVLLSTSDSNGEGKDGIKKMWERRCQRWIEEKKSLLRGLRNVPIIYDSENSIKLETHDDGIHIILDPEDMKYGSINAQQNSIYLKFKTPIALKTELEFERKIVKKRLKLPRSSW